MYRVTFNIKYLHTVTEACYNLQSMFFFFFFFFFAVPFWLVSIFDHYLSSLFVLLCGLILNLCLSDLISFVKALYMRRSL
jgi:hypothetical protein